MVIGRLDNIKSQNASFKCRDGNLTQEIMRALYKLQKPIDKRTISGQK